MSKLSVLNDAIDKLEAAEIAVMNARRAFVSQSTEYNILDGQFEIIGDALGIVKRIMSKVEQEKFPVK